MSPPNLSSNLVSWGFLRFGRRERRSWSGKPQSVLESTPADLEFASRLLVAKARGFRLGFSFSRVVGFGFIPNVHSPSVDQIRATVQLPRAAALSPATAAARGGPEFQFKFTPGPLQSTPNTKQPTEYPRANEPEDPAHEPYQTGEPKEDRGSIRIDSPAKLALYLGLFIAFFTALLAFFTVNDFNGPEKSLPSIVQSPITSNAANSTGAAIGLSVITVQVWRVSGFTGSRIFERLAGPLTRDLDKF